MTEEERAAQYRAQCAARLQARKDQLAALAGSPTARAALEERWAPLRDWLRERKTH
jgi:hypothetical protein